MEGVAGLLHVLLLFKSRDGNQVLTGASSLQGMFPEAKAKKALACFADLIGDGYTPPPGTPANSTFSQHLTLSTPGTPDDLRWDTEGWDVEDYSDPAVTGQDPEPSIEDFVSRGPSTESAVATPAVEPATATP